MQNKILRCLAGLLMPFAAYGAQASYGAYQRRSLSRTAGCSSLDLSVPTPSWLVRDPIVVEADLLATLPGRMARELVIVDASVKDRHVILKQARPGLDVVEIPAGASGTAAFAQALQGYHDLRAVHVVAHAEAGAMFLGGHRVDQESLLKDPAVFAALNRAVRDGGDLLLYGCDLAQGEAGQDFLEIVRANTHADVAASIDPTGHETLGGDWDLEIRTGDIDTKPLPHSIALKDFSDVLAASGGTYGFQTGWTDAGNTLTSTHFTVSARDTNSSAPVNVSIYNDIPYPAYIQNGIVSGSNYFYVSADGVNTGSFELTGLTSGEYATGQFTNVRIVGVLPDDTLITSSTINGNPAVPEEGFNFGAGQLANFAGVQLKAFKLYFDTTSHVPSTVPFFELRTFTIANAQNPADSDGNVTAAGGVTEPVGLDTTRDTVGEAVDVFDFTISDGGTSDGKAMGVSRVVIHVSGTSTNAERSQVTWRLNGPDAFNVAGTYDTGTNAITFSGLSISVADGGNETYTVNAYYNDNTAITDGHTVILSIDGDIDVTVGAGGTKMGSTSPVTNGTGSTLDVIATQLVFTTQPAGSVSGAALTTQPVVAARDAFGNTDRGFTETITLTEASAGSLSNNTQAASSGVATFTGLIYTATADQQAFTLTANDQDGVGSDLPTADSNSVNSNVVATKLLFTTQPAPTTITSGAVTNFFTVPVVSAVDANNTLDTGYSTSIVLSVTDPNDGTVDGTVNGLAGTGDTDGSGTTVTLAPSSGIATFTGLVLTYTSGGASDTIALRAASGGLTAAISNFITASSSPTVTDANISISGASGTGGAYKIGDTVTATWNNTAGGDNNSGIVSVTVDFSGFGGGAAVAATNSSDTWTATYTIVAGAIDATNRNVSVSATNAAGTTTTADTTNATVDNVAPTVSDANVSISGGSGTGGVYKIGDTVTATWNNTAGGDNNSDTISGVTVDFNEFGGGAAVAATNSGGTWTATYTIVSGAIDATNRNVTVAATDNAGNTTTVADTTNATVDNVAPTVSDANVSISGASGTGGVYKIGDTVTATWNNTAGGDNNSDTISGVTVDFTEFGGGAAVAATNSGGTWTATYTLVAGAIDTTNCNISVTATDNAGNATTTADTTNATVDNEEPAAPSTPDLEPGSDTGTLDADDITNDTTPTFTGTAEPNATVTVSSDVAGVLGSTTANGSGDWSFTVSTALAAGQHAITANVADSVGNSSADSAALQVTIDTTAPDQPLISAISDDTGASATDQITADTTLLLSGTAEADAIVTIYRNAAQIGTATANGSGAWSFDYTGTTLAGGTHTFTASAADAAGNISASSIDFIVEIDEITPAAPVVTAITDDTGASSTDGITTDPTLVISGTAEPDALITVSRSGAGVIGTATADGDGAWSFDHTGTTLVDGEYLFTAFATDTAGNASTVSADFPVTIDTVTQAPALTAPATDSTDNATLAVAFSIRETPLAGTIKLTFTRTGGAADPNSPHVLTFTDGSTSVATTLNGGNLGSHASVVSITGGSALVDGATYTITISYQDVAGNPIATTNQTGFVYDNSVAAPAMPDLVSASDSGASSADNITSDTTPTFTGSTEPGSTVTLFVDGNSAGTTTADGSGNWTFTTGALADGIYAITTRSTDTVGNSSADSPALSVTIDTTAPVITSNATASGTFGSAFSYSITASGSPVSFDTLGLPGGLSINSATGAISGTPTAVGTTNLTMAATDAAGNTGTAGLSITIAKANQTVAFGPVGAVTVGTPVTLSASASSGLPVTFSVVSGNATVAGNSFTAKDANTIVLRATQAGDSNFNAASADQTIASSNIAKRSQTITFAQPADKLITDAAFALSATASSELTVTFTVQSGPATISGDTLTLTGVPGTVTIVASQAGNDVYAAASPVTRSFAVSSPAPLTYFGLLVDGTETLGDFAAHLSADGSSGTMIGYLPGLDSGFVVTFTPDVNGAFTVSITPLSTPDIQSARTGASGLAMMAAPSTWTFHGQISGDTITGSIEELALDFAGTADPIVGPTAELSGYYTSASLDTTNGAVHSIVGTNGDVYVLAITPDLVVGDANEIDAATGDFVIDIADGLTIDGNVHAATKTVDGAIIRADGPVVDFAGVRSDVARTDRLLNLSSRGLAGHGANVLITGFAISGTEPRPVLIRAVGPGLTGLGVTTPVANPRLHLYRGGKLIDENDDWSASANQSDLLAAMKRTHAFGLDVDSRDAALLVTLAPGTYTAHIEDPAGQGIALAEIYDASEDGAGDYERLVNISTRGYVGAGEEVLIGGFIVAGNSPKRVLVRAVGPGLTALGVDGVLGNPNLRIVDRLGEIVAVNDDWGAEANSAEELAAAASATGAFALTNGSRDAALLLTIAPGAYTAIVTGADGGAGVALIEVYEVAE